jgi:hypothetical protein
MKRAYIVRFAAEDCTNTTAPWKINVDPLSTPALEGNRDYHVAMVIIAFLVAAQSKRFGRKLVPSPRAGR